MNGWKILGMALLFCGAAGIGFGSAAAVRRMNTQLEQIKLSLELMHCEIEYALTPVEKLCGILEHSCQGQVAVFYGKMAQQIKGGCTVGEAQKRALRGNQKLRLPEQTKRALDELFSSFGSYDSDGQLKLIDLALAQVSGELEQLRVQQPSRCRSYEVLGICTGFAMMILVI